MTFTITTDSKSRSITLKLQHLQYYSKKAIRSAFYEIGAIAKRNIQDEIRSVPRYGRQETFQGRKRNASLPGESFANKSGDADATLKFQVHGTYEVEFGFGANEKTMYTKILEESSKSKQRPTLQIASDKLKGNAHTIMIKELEKSHLEGFK